jgi:hypothetical protein
MTPDSRSLPGAKKKNRYQSGKGSQLCATYESQRSGKNGNRQWYIELK